MKTIKVTCGSCGGTGQNSEWKDDDTPNPPSWVVTDCMSCKGTGKIDVKIVDKRLLSAQRTIELPESC